MTFDTTQSERRCSQKTSVGWTAGEQIKSIDFRDLEPGKYEVMLELSGGEVTATKTDPEGVFLQKISTKTLAKGNFIRPTDFSKLADERGLLPETHHGILFTGFECDHRQMYLKPGGAGSTKAFTQWLRAVIAHMKGKGYEYNDFSSFGPMSYLRKRR